MAARRHVLVTDAGRGSAVSIIRSLGRRGWRVTAADSDPASPGFRSRYTTDRLVYPRPSTRPDAMVEAIHRAVTSTGVDLVIPVTDEVGLPIAEGRATFAGHAVLALPEPRALAATHDKATTVALAERLGVPVPLTRVVRPGDDAISAAAELGYPVVVKPIASREVLRDGTIGAYAVSYATDADDLRRRLGSGGRGGRDGQDDRERRDDRTAAAGAGTVLLQRWLPGDGIGVELLMDRGRPLAAFQHRRIREVPPTGGASALRESVDIDSDLYEGAVAMLRELGWTGLAMVEFRRGHDGIGHLMEINGRVWGSLPLAVRAGMDFPGRLADLLLDGPPPTDVPVATDYRRGLRARNLRLDLLWIRTVLSGRRRQRGLPWPGRGSALRAIASLADPRIADDLLMRSDPGPGLAQIATIARDGLGRVGGGRRG